MSGENVDLATDAGVIEESSKVFTVGTRDKDGNNAIFHAEANTYDEAMEMVTTEMKESGVEKPVVLVLVKGT